MFLLGHCKLAAIQRDGCPWQSCSHFCFFLLRTDTHPFALKMVYFLMFEGDGCTHADAIVPCFGRFGHLVFFEGFFSDMFEAGCLEGIFMSLVIFGIFGALFVYLVDSVVSFFGLFGVPAAVVAAFV